jgi:hypothetical protein
MHRMSNLNKSKNSYQVLENKFRTLLHEEKTNSKIHKEHLNIFFGQRFLPQTPYVLMCIKCMNVTRIECLIAM